MFFPYRCAKIFFAVGFGGADQGCSILPGLIDIKDEDAVLIERDFSGLPAGFVAVEVGLIVIDGNQLFDDGVLRLPIEATSAPAPSPQSQASADQEDEDEERLG